MIQQQPGGGLREAGDRVRELADGAAGQGMAGLDALLDFRLLRLAGLTITVGGVVAAILALVLAWAASALVRRALRRYGDRHAGANKAALYTVSRLTHYLLLFVGVMVALHLAGISLDKFTIFAGAIGVGLGFGLQTIFSNFVSGLILLFDQSLKVGDFVELDAELRGNVRAINIRSTRITTNDNIDVLVPNSEFVSKRLVNWTHGSENRRIRVPFRAALGVDKELVKKAALEAASKVPFTLAMEGDRAPQVWLVDFGESAADFLLVVWLTEEAARRNVAIRAAYLWELDTALKRYAIEVPLPQRELHVRRLFGLSEDDALQALRARMDRAAEPQRVPRAEDPEARAPELAPHERAALARNDAQLDTARQIARDAELARQDRAGADRTEPDEDERNG